MTLPEPRVQTPAHEFVRLAQLHRMDGREDLALAILETASRLVPVDASVFFELAQAHAAAGRIDRALALYDQALTIDPDFREAHWQRGVLLERRGQIDEALEAWRRSDVTGDPYRHSLYLAAALKSAQSTNETLLEEHRDWARHHARTS